MSSPTMAPNPFLLYGIPTLGGLLTWLFLALALRAGRRRRLVSDLPTCKTTGIFIGLVELQGTAEVEQPLVSYLAQQGCVYFRWSVDEHWSRTVTETYTDSEGRTQTRTRTESGWTNVAHGGEDIPFYLQDDCGVVLVQPHQAKVEPGTVFDHSCGPLDPLYYGKGPRHAVADSTHRRRFVERAIPLHARIFIIGHARERQDVVAPEIAYDRNSEMFLISTRTKEQVRRGLAWQFWLVGVLGLVFGVGGFVIGDAAVQHPPPEHVGKYILAGFFVVAAWLAGGVWMVYNSLIDLRQRVRQAWSNVDVQLKRRQDLIPALVNVVPGMAHHEQSLQTELARLRSQLTATPPGQPGPDPAAVGNILMAVRERYPELKAEGNFQNLQENLIDTEQRIALARGYFNSIASFYNARLESVPDRFIAVLGALGPQPLMAANDFERAAVPVKLAG